MNSKIISAVFAASALPLVAAIELGTPFSDGAVLQRGMKVPVWGKVVDADFAGSRIEVEFAGQKKTASIAENGEWKVALDPLEASKESRTLKVSRIVDGFIFDSIAESLEVKDVLVGEVWFASGQSNMECPIWGDNTRYRDMKGGILTTMTRLPCVRYVKCRRDWKVEPKQLKAKWCKFTPEDLQLFYRGDQLKGTQLSAVAFYYARELYLALDIPVGILDASWGGTNIDAWTPRSGYDGCDESIKGTAEYKVKQDWNAKVDKKGPIGGPHQQPTVLYNGMVASFAPMAMRGFIWYQGCHNSGEANLYCAKLHALYNGWSRDFGNENLKLYLVQLAPWIHNWLGICEAQTRFCAEQKNAALAVTADVGNFDDIHPNDKEIVAKRLAVHALKRDYGFAIPEDDSPVLKAASVKDGKVSLVFDNVKDWYVYAPDRSRAPAFELAGEDGKWYEAKVVNYRKGKDRQGKQVDTDYIDGDTVIIASDAVAKPVKARYMGKNRTVGTLYNEASLPLGPFECSPRN
jgi:sialate O-acetylesterase